MRIREPWPKPKVIIHQIRWPLTEKEIRKIAEPYFMNSRKDLAKKEKCATCGTEYPRTEMRGTNNGDWLCIADWEDKHGSAVPPPVPVYTPPRAN